MVSFGPWATQAADYLQFDTVNGDSDATDPISGRPLFEYGLGSNNTQTPFQDPRYPITNTDLRLSVEGSYDSQFASNGIGSTWGTAYGWSYSLSAPLWASNWGASVVRRRFLIADRQYGYNPVNEGFWEPGAIGIDYEGQPYNPADPWASGPASFVSRAISSAAPTTLRGLWYETESGGVVGMRSPTTEVVFTADVLPGAAASETVLATLEAPLPPSQPHEFLEEREMALPADLDLTGLLLPDLRSGVVWTRASPLFEAPLTDPAEPTSGEVRYGWGFASIRVDTMVRPPLWRWVFAGESAESYRRIFPRGDGIAGGAGRTFPRPSSVQGSNRTSGNYL